jgi:hypothetical protein
MCIRWMRPAPRRLRAGMTGIRGLHELIAAYCDEPAQVVVGIETDRGLWVPALVAAGYQVWAINPMAAAATATATTSQGRSRIALMPGPPRRRSG